MNKDFSNQKNTINLVLVIILIAAAIYFGIRPLAAKLASVYRDNREKSAYLNTLSIELSDLENAEKTLKSKRNLIDDVLTYLPEKDASNFITQVETLAQKIGGSCDSIKFQEEKTPYVTNADVDEKIFEIVFTGNFNAIRGFLVGLNKLNQYNNIYTVSISVEENKTYATIVGGIYTRKAQNEKNNTSSNQSR